MVKEDLLLLLKYLKSALISVDNCDILNFQINFYQCNNKCEGTKQRFNPLIYCTIP